MLVRTVTAITSGACRPSFAAVSRAASRRRLHHRRVPPDAWTLIIHTPSDCRRDRLRDRVRDVVEFQVEEDAVAALGQCANERGPSSVNRRLPILKPPATPRSASASWIARSPLSTSSATRS